MTECVCSSYSSLIAAEQLFIKKWEYFLEGQSPYGYPNPGWRDGSLTPFINIAELSRAELGGSCTFVGTDKQWLCFFHRGMRTNGITESISGESLPSAPVMIDFIMCDKLSLKSLLSFFYLALSTKLCSIQNK